MTVLPLPQQSSADVKLAADKSVIQLGESVDLYIDPPDSVYNYVFNFDDGTPEQTKDRNMRSISHKFATVGTHKVSAAAVAPAGVAPFEAEIFPKQIVVEHVQISADPNSVEIGIPVSIRATSVSKDTSLLYRFSFDDGIQTAWQSSNEAPPHTYTVIREYHPQVEVAFVKDVPLDSATFVAVKVLPASVQALIFTATPSRVNAGELVTFTAAYPDKKRHLQYRFNYGDEHPGVWQDEVKAEHSYTSGPSHDASVEVGVLINGTVTVLVSSPAKTIEVNATQVTVTSPTQNPLGPTPKPPGPEWPWFLIAIIGGVLIVIGVFAGTLMVAYKAGIWPFSPKPTFVSHLDVGNATTMDHNGAVSLIEFEVEWNPNVSGGFFDVRTSELKLVRAERIRL
ncbi:MAG: PKD domain-containing protein [Pyrinomonadaceae bacterium]